MGHGYHKKMLCSAVSVRPSKYLSESCACSLSRIFRFMSGSNLSFPSSANLTKFCIASLNLESAPMNEWDDLATERTNSVCAVNPGYEPTGLCTEGFGHQPEKPSLFVAYDSKSHFA